MVGILLLPFTLPMRLLSAVFLDLRFGLPVLAIAVVLVIWVLPSLSLPPPFSPASPTPNPAPIVLPETPGPAATPAPAAAEAVVVAGTNGQGLNLRRTPGGERLTSWPDGTQLHIAGPDEISEGALWKHVLDPAGNEGYVSATYVRPAP
ncbi:MAG: SH3 domain-containing protein [Chloroflexota bacterium]